MALLGAPIPLGSTVRRRREFELSTDNVKLCRTFVDERATPVRHSEQELMRYVVQEYEQSEDYAILTMIH